MAQLSLGLTVPQCSSCRPLHPNNPVRILSDAALIDLTAVPTLTNRSLFDVIPESNALVSGAYGRISLHEQLLLLTPLTRPHNHIHVTLAKDSLRYHPPRSPYTPRESPGVQPNLGVTDSNWVAKWSQNGRAPRSSGGCSSHRSPPRKSPQEAAASTSRGSPGTAKAQEPFLPRPCNVASFYACPCLGVRISAIETEHKLDWKVQV